MRTRESIAGSVRQPRFHGIPRHSTQVMQDASDGKKTSRGRGSRKYEIPLTALGDTYVRTNKVYSRDSSKNPWKKDTTLSPLSLRTRCVCGGGGGTQSNTTRCQHLSHSRLAKDHRAHVGAAARRSARKACDVMGRNKAGAR